MRHNQTKIKYFKKKNELIKNLDSFFNWVKGAELVELKSCNIIRGPSSS